MYGRRLAASQYSPQSPAMIASLALLLCAVAGSQQVTITEFVVPNAIELGESAELQCKFSADARNPMVKWWWTPANSTIEKRVLIYQWLGGQEQPQLLPHNLSIQLKDNSSIVLSKLQPTHSGTYECEVSELTGDEDREDQDLIVYSKGTGPEVNISTETVETAEGPERKVYITCEAQDAAPWPELGVTVDGKAIDIDETLEQSPVDGTFDIYVNATLDAAALHDGATVACELYFRNGNISHPAYIDTEVFETDDANAATTVLVSDAETEVSVTDTNNTTDASAHAAASCGLLAAAALLLRLI